MPLFTQMLGTLNDLLDKAEAHIEEKDLDPDTLLKARLYPDMFPFLSQVQFSCDFVKGAMARLSGVDVPNYADTEQTIDELRARIQNTLDLIATFKKSEIDGQEGREINMAFGNLQLSAGGQDYLIGFVIPSLVFHVTTAYGILRHNGVDIGKLDFLGKVAGMTGLGGELVS
jgi:hypothetical protein